MQINCSQDIYHNGEAISSLAVLARSLAYFEALYPLSARETLAGAGKYNRFDIPDFTLHGSEIAAAKSDNRGLFGMFPTVHEPEQKLSIAGPRLLGEAGCKMVMWQGRKKFTALLHQLTFDFITGEPYKASSNGDTHRKKGQVVLRQAAIFTNHNGDSVTIPAGTALTDLYDSRKWAQDASANRKFDMVDANGKPFTPTIMTAMLWGHVAAATGINRHGDRSRKQQTLMEDGTDDNIRAERALIRWVAEAAEHHIDVLPEMNRYIEQARATISKNHGWMQALAVVESVDEAILATVSPPPFNSNDMRTINYEAASYRSAAMRTLKITFNLDLAPYRKSPECKAIADPLIQQMREIVNRKTLPEKPATTVCAAQADGAALPVGHACNHRLTLEQTARTPERK